MLKKLAGFFRISLREKCPNIVFPGQYFPLFGVNTGKWGPEKTPYLYTFYTVFILIIM